jgi:lantibiotic transport system permease protein
MNMTTALLNGIQSEWLKKRHTASIWLILASAFFMPVLTLMMRLTHLEETRNENMLKQLWAVMHYRNWAAMSMFFLPMTLILFVTLITNMEYKNNTWKQLHATPQSFHVIFLSKYIVLFLMTMQLFLLFHVGIYVSAIIPSLLVRDIPFPSAPFPLKDYTRAAMYFFVDCTPIIALQYLLGLRFKNFLVAIGVGFSLLVVSLLALNWKYGYVVPYTYLPLGLKENRNFVDQSVSRHWCAIGYFVVITLVSYLLYIKKEEKS